MQKSRNKKGIGIIKKITLVDMPLLITVFILLGFGLIMVLSASAPSALATYGNSYKNFFTQLEAAGLGLLLMVIAIEFDYTKLKKFYKVIYVLSILILFLVLVPKLGVVSNGARRWIKLGSIQFQPSEITKIGLIISLAGYYTDDRINHNNFMNCVFIPLLLAGVPVILLLLIQNHLSAGAVIGIVSLIIIIMSGNMKGYVLRTTGIGAIFASAYLLYKKANSSEKSFRANRIDAWLHPLENASGTAYQTTQGLYAIGSGRLFGVGIGNSKQKYSYIPEAHNDFIFAIIAEELGFVGCIFVISLFIIFTVRGIIISMRAKDMFGSLVAIGITSLIAIQAILNIAVVTNSIPNTGISLPFLSYGGTSLIILLISVGILLSISKQENKI